VNERDPRESRLPKWAQEELSSLRYKLEVERQRVEEMRGNVPNADTFVRDYTSKDRPLPLGARVAFHTVPDDGRLRRAIIAHVEDGKLCIQGDHSFVIHPRASNSVYIEFEERYR
jgi:hypothetical protein